MKVGVVTFPGSNCDEDMVYVMESILGLKIERLWHKEHDLKSSDLIVLPGGFSYGDYLRSGAIAKFSPIMTEVVQYAQKGGFVLGICNGFQILCESGLLNGALLHNQKQKFICKNVFLKPKHFNSAITKNLQKNKTYKIPIAHGEGRFYIDDEGLKKMEDNEQVVFQYCSEIGEVTAEYNPNGSLNNIAGICNSKKNVFGMMPHPERAADKTLFNEDGKEILESLINQMVKA